jgi:[lysine-biosynthesis-protein LysW]--L-2-aminoadipate ligase
MIERQREIAPERVWVLAGHSTLTNDLLLGALHERGVPAELVGSERVSRVARRCDLILGRLDVRPTLDGVDEGLSALADLQLRGMRVLNTASTLLACHDKLQTAIRLGRRGVPQPTTAHIDLGGPIPDLEYPVVVKPRFGSWGHDVVLCDSEKQLQRVLRRLRNRNWFKRHGVLLQALVEPFGFDLRAVVAGGRVVGAVRRVAAPGEWRTNIARGGSRSPIEPPDNACSLAVAAAAAVGGDVVGVDLLPLRDGGFVVLEVNGAVEFTHEYSRGAGDVFDDVAAFVADAATDAAAI